MNIRDMPGVFHLPGQTENIRRLYHNGAYGKNWEEKIQRFLALVDHLAEDEALAPQIVYTSHARLLFLQQDNPGHVLVVAHAYASSSEKHYEVKYRLPLPWFWGAGDAADVTAAKHMILEGLQKADLWTPKQENIKTTMDI